MTNPGTDPGNAQAALRSTTTAWKPLNPTRGSSSPSSPATKSSPSTWQPVQEIIRVPEVVRVPLAPPTLDGLANLRGKVLPIISLRRIFGFDEQDYDDATRALVIDIGQPLGFVVDRVASVVGVEPGKIEDVAASAAPSIPNCCPASSRTSAATR
jgi:hypothetical protein